MRDLTLLPSTVQSSAIRTESGEVMWPRNVAAQAVEALAASGHLVLGLDLRSDGIGPTPPGLATEIPLSSFRPDDDAPETQIGVARDHALSALRHPDLADFAGYDWVLITWTSK